MTPKEYQNKLRQNILSMYDNPVDPQRIESILDDNFQKGLISEDQLEKAYQQFDELVKAKSGIYADTYQNRKLGRVGQKYGSKGGSEEKEGVFEPDKKIPLGKDSTGEMQYGILKEKEGDKWKVTLDGGGHVTLSEKELRDSSKESIKDKNDKSQKDMKSEDAQEKKQFKSEKKKTIKNITQTTEFHPAIGRTYNVELSDGSFVQMADEDFLALYPETRESNFDKNLLIGQEYKT